MGLGMFPVFVLREAHAVLPTSRITSFTVVELGRLVSKLDTAKVAFDWSIVVFEFYDDHLCVAFFDKRHLRDAPAAHDGRW